MAKVALIDCTDCPRGTEEIFDSTLALLDLAARLKAALEEADAHMMCDEDGEFHDQIREGTRGPCAGCAAEINVRAALAAAREAQL